MKTKEQILQAYKDGRKSEAFDGRDDARLAAFFGVEDYAAFGVKLKDGAEPPEPEPWTEENVKRHLAGDLEFAFEKALDQRGISASCMYAVIKTWMWVLDDPLADFDEYAQYGLPLLKAVAVKYGLPNPIGDDDGDENKYAA